VRGGDPGAMVGHVNEGEVNKRVDGGRERTGLLNKRNVSHGASP
jgi:hypothetical protein